MKKLFKVIAVIFIGLVFLGWLLPDSKKDKATGSALASTSETTTPVAATGEVAETAPAEAEKPELEILKSNETVTQYMRKIHVKVRNNTDHLISYADLKGVYYNKKGDVVGTGMGNAANIAAGATKTIDVMSMGIEGASRYEVEVGNVIGKM